MKRFALIGAAGYIAPRHLQAIHEVGGTLVAAYDPSDSVGHLDAYFPKAAFFTEFERFDRHLNKLSERGEAAEYISICSPNYLHDSHIRYALRNEAHCICEKPITLRPWNVEGLTATAQSTGKKIFTILQLRLHEQVIALKEQVQKKLDTDPIIFSMRTSRTSPREATGIMPLGKEMRKRVEVLPPTLAFISSICSNGFSALLRAKESMYARTTEPPVPFASAMQTFDGF